MSLIASVAFVGACLVRPSDESPPEDLDLRVDDPFEPACRFSYAIEDRVVAPDDEPEVVPQRVDPLTRRSTEAAIRSGGVRFDVVPSSTATSGATWRVTRDGTDAISLGEDVEVGAGVQVLDDGAGTILVEWIERGPERRSHVALVSSDGSVVPVASNTTRRVLGIVGFSNEPGGWVLIVESRSEVHVLHLDAAGVETASSMFFPSFVEATFRIDGRPWVAIRVGEDLRVGPIARIEDAPVLARDLGRVDDIATLPTGDGFWLLMNVSWQHQHSADAPPELRFLRLRADGTEIGRVHVRSVGWAGMQLADVHLEGGFPTLLASSGFRGARWHRISVVDAPPCTPPTAGPCDPSAELLDPAHEVTWDDHDPDGMSAWRALPDGHESASRPIAVDGGLAFVSRSPEQVASIRVVSRTTGQESAAPVPLPSGMTRADLANTSQGLFGCAVGGRGLGVFDAAGLEHGRSLVVFDAGGVERTRVEGSWVDCAIGRTRDALVVAAIDSVPFTSAGPMQRVSLFSLDPRSGRIQRRWDDVAYGSRLLGIVGADDSEEGGAEVVVDTWQDVRVLRLDSAGEVTGDPRLLATVYFNRVAVLVRSDSGPEVRWAHRTARGRVPLCHHRP